MKEYEPSQLVEPAGGAAMGTPSVNAPPKVNQQPIQSAQQSADPNQATLQAFQSILAQQLEKQEARLREKLEEKFEAKLKDQLEEKLETIRQEM